MHFGWPEILLIIILVLVLFGHNKFPGMMKNLADGLKVFKSEMKDEKPTKKQATSKKQTDNKKVVKKQTKKK
jgi:sec-independent protein translocase protein TatA